jgi:hypothetical protein
LHAEEERIALPRGAADDAARTNMFGLEYSIY